MEGPFPCWLPAPVNLGQGKFAQTSAQGTEVLHLISVQDSGSRLGHLGASSALGRFSQSPGPGAWAGRWVVDNSAPLLRWHVSQCPQRHSRCVPCHSGPRKDSSQRVRQSLLAGSFAGKASVWLWAKPWKILRSPRSFRPLVFTERSLRARQQFCWDEAENETGAWHCSSRRRRRKASGLRK